MAGGAQQALFSVIAHPWLSSDIEGLPNMLCEALCMALPRVTTDAGDAALNAGDTAPGCQRGEEQALSAALPQLEDMPVHERASMGACDKSPAAVPSAIA